FHHVPSFGRDTIWCFHKNVSEMKRLAAQGFEDMLQCSIPVFAGVLPDPYNAQVLRLLFVLCHWHGHAKLRVHTDETFSCVSQCWASVYVR
ncbi:hypothetical protein BDN67DRAFT_913558, partial [Paxillus ammoniavirescens]